MLKISDYADRIIALHNKGLSAKKISVVLGLKYHQPIYNFFKKQGWKTGIYNKDRIYNVNCNFFNKINTEEKAYILGFICADGHVEFNRIRIALAAKDVDILHKIKKALNSTHPIRKYIATNPYKKSTRPLLNMVELTINSIDLVQPLIKMGLLGNKTLSLNGSITKYIPKYLMRDFLRGYFDGDGNVFFGRKYDSGYKYNINVCGNEDFLLNTYQKYFPTTNKLYKDLYSKQCYIWKISQRDRVRDFMYYLYNNSSIHLSRKYNEFRKIMWSYKTGLIAGNSYPNLLLLGGQSAANL